MKGPPFLPTSCKGFPDSTQGILVPIPRSTARSNARCAAATSSTAIPSDLKMVISSGVDRPRTRPAATSPSSPATWSRVIAPSAIGIRMSPASAKAPGTGVHEDPRGADERRIHLSLIGPARAHGAEVGAGLYPLRLHYGLPRRGDERHEVRTFHGVARGCRSDDSARCCRLRGVDERLPSGRVRTPDADLAQCPNVGEGLQMASRLDAGSNQREDAGVLARQQTRRDRRHRAGPRFRDVTAVHDRAKSASRGIEQDDGREM